MPFITSPSTAVDDSTLEEASGIIKIKGKTIYKGTGLDITGLQGKNRYKGHIKLDCSASDGKLYLAYNGGANITGCRKLACTTTATSVTTQDYFLDLDNINGLILWFEIYLNGTMATIQLHSHNQSYLYLQSHRVDVGAAISQITFSAAGSTITDSDYYLEEWSD